MKIICPSCSAKFNVKDELLQPNGRTVKCSKCAHRWRAMPDGEPADDADDAVPPPPPEARAERKAEDEPPRRKAKKEPPPPPTTDDLGRRGRGRSRDEDEQDDDLPPPPPVEPPPIPPESRFQPPEPPSRGNTLMIAWGVLIVAVVFTLIGAVLFRKDIVGFYPPSQNLYAAVGLPTDTLGHGLKILRPEVEAQVDASSRRVDIRGEIENTTGDVIQIPMLRAALLDSSGIELEAWSFQAQEQQVLPGERIRYVTEVTNPPSGTTSVQITFTHGAMPTSGRSTPKEAGSKEAGPKEAGPKEGEMPGAAMQSGNGQQEGMSTAPADTSSPPPDAGQVQQQPAQGEPHVQAQDHAPPPTAPQN